MDLGYGVLEVHEALTPPGLALELHVVVGSDEHGTLAWWEAENGTWLGHVEVGLA